MTSQHTGNGREPVNLQRQTIVLKTPAAGVNEPNGDVSLVDGQVSKNVLINVATFFPAPA